MKLDAGDASSSATPLSSSGSAMRPIATIDSHASSGIGRVAADVGAERAGRDRVHVHAVRASSKRGLAHEHDHRRLGRGVGVADHRVGADAGGRGGDDDAPAALLLHVRAASRMVNRTPSRLIPSTVRQVSSSRFLEPAALVQHPGLGDTPGIREGDIDAVLLAPRRRTARSTAVDRRRRRSRCGRRAGRAAARSRPSPSRSASVTARPPSAITSAIASPSPLAAPVTTVRRPETSKRSLNPTPPPRPRRSGAAWRPARRR